MRCGWILTSHVDDDDGGRGNSTWYLILKCCPVRGRVGY